MEDVIIVYRGTELKILFTAESDSEVDLTASKFEIKYYTTDEKKALVASKDMGASTLKYVIGKEGDNTLLIRIPTQDLDAGMLKCKATIYVPDDDFANDDEDTGELEEPIETNSDLDGYRKEIIKKTTNIKITD